MPFLDRYRIFPLIVTILIVAFAFKFSDFVMHGKFLGAGTPAALAVDEAHDAKPPPMDKDHIPSGNSSDGKDVGKTYGESLADAPRSFTSSEIELLQSLAERRKKIEMREKEMKVNMALLQAAEQEVDQKISELNKLKSEIQDLLGQQEEEEKQRIQSLVKIYETMKPKDAARIMDNLEMDVLLAVLGGMSTRKSAPILASMNPERARAVTIKLSEQRKLPEIND